MRIDLRRSIRNIVVLVKGLIMPTEVMEPPISDVVSSTEDVGEKKGKRGRVKAEDDLRQEFVVPVEMLAENGRIKVWPNDCGYIFGAEVICHRPIKKASFASEEIYVDYRIGGKEAFIKLLQDEINLMKKNRDQFNSIENVQTRSKMKKVGKLKSQVKALMKQLAEDGCNVEDFLDED